MTGTKVLQQSWAIALDLDVDDINEDDNFFDIGGDSVQAIRLVEAAREVGRKLDVETVFNHPDFQDMLANSEEVFATSCSSEASSLGSLDTATIQACADSCGIAPELIEDIFPSVDLQNLLMQLHLQSGSYVLQLVFELEGIRDTALVRRAFDTIRAKNQVLRTRLVQMGSDVLQVALKDPIVWHNATDLKTYTAKDSESRMGYGQPLVRYAVVQEPEKTYIVWTAHHSLMDKWTRRLFLDDLESYLVDPVAFTMKPNRPSFRNFVDYRRSLDAEEANAFLERYFAQLPDTMKLYTLPDSYKPSLRRTHSREVPINRPTKSAITVSNIAHVAFALSIGQITGSHEISLRSIRGSRAISMPGVESIMGPMVTSVPLHIRLPPKEPVSTVLRSLQDLSTLMLKYELFSGQYFMRRGLVRDQVLFNWYPRGSDISTRLVRFTTGEDKASLRVVREQYTEVRGLVGCVIHNYDNGDHIKIMVQFDDQLLEESLIEKLLDLFITNLGRLCAGQEMSVESLMV